MRVSCLKIVRTRASVTQGTTSARKSTNVHLRLTRGDNGLGARIRGRYATEESLSQFMNVKRCLGTQ